MYHEGVGKLSFWLSFAGTALTFFPMHIVGLLGMPRRNYTYDADMGWTGLNLTETIGSYVLTAGLLVVAANLTVSLFRGRPAGNDPFGGDTLEWTTTSPPPPYNYPVIPKVSSPYAGWDKQDREEDARRLARGQRVLERGHETTASTVLDAEFDEILEMPSDSPWPVLLAVALSAVFVMLLTGHLTTAVVFAGAGAAVLAAWHWREPGAA
jgi:cytochrome c oxidase subunit 1/cytochrome c oxidase subunit I+III